MTINLVGFAQATVVDGSANTTITGVLPSGGSVGNLLIAVLSSNDVLNPSDVTVPVGWNLIGNNYNSNGNFNTHLAVCWKIREASNELVWTVGADTRDDQLIITEWSGSFDVANPVSSVQLSPGSQAVTFTSPANNTSSPNSLLVAFASSKNGASANESLYPVDMTGVTNSRTRANSSGLRTAIAYQEYSTITSTPAKPWTNFVSTAYTGNAGSFIINDKQDVGIVSVNDNDTVRDNVSNNTIVFDKVVSSIQSLAIEDLDGNDTMLFDYTGSGTTWQFSSVVSEVTENASWGEVVLKAEVTTADGTENFSKSIYYLPPAGYDFVTITDTTNLDENSVGYGVVEVQEGSQFAFNSENTVVFEDASGYTTIEGSQEVLHVFLGQLTNFSLISGDSNNISVITSPQIIGTFRVREDVMCLPGEYSSPSGEVTVVNYNWKYDNVPVGLEIQGLQILDVAYGKIVSCDVVVTDGTNTSTFTAASLVPVAGIAPILTLQPIAGLPEVGRTLRITYDVDAVPEADVSVEWIRLEDGVVLATGVDNYRVKQSDLGSSIFAQVKATNPEGEVIESAQAIGPITPFTGITRRNIPPFWQ